MRATTLFALAVASTFAVAGGAPAAVIPHTAIVSFSGGAWTTVPGSDTIGWEFQVTEPISVTQLGFVDQGADGLAAAHPVGLFQPTGPITGNLLASVTIDNDDPLTGTTRYESLASPVALTPGVTYVIGAYVSPTNTDNWLSSPSSVSRDPIIRYGGAHFGGSSSGLSYPYSLNATNSGRYGPNFQFVVPEPAGLGLMLLGCSTIGAIRRRRRI